MSVGRIERERPVRVGDTVHLPVQDPPAAAAAGIVRICKVIGVRHHDDGKIFVVLSGIAEPVPVDQVVIGPSPLEREFEKLFDERVKAGDVGAPFEADAVRLLRDLRRTQPADYQRARAAEGMRHQGCGIGQVDRAAQAAARRRGG